MLKSLLHKFKNRISSEPQGMDAPVFWNDDEIKDKIPECKLPENTTATKKRPSLPTVAYTSPEDDRISSTSIDELRREQNKRMRQAVLRNKPFRKKKRGRNLASSNIPIATVSLFESKECSSIEDDSIWGIPDYFNSGWKDGWNGPGYYIGGKKLEYEDD